MKEMKNRNMYKVGALVLAFGFLFVGAFSLFTDNKTDSQSAKTAKVELGALTFVVDKAGVPMLPGETKSLSLNAVNVSDTAVKARITYTLESTASSVLTLTVDGTKAVSNKVVIEKDLAVGANISHTGSLALDLTAGNQFQEAPVKVTALVEILQADGTWTPTVVPAKAK